MKTFLIQKPKDKTTCSLLEPYYDRKDGRTKKRYLGSFNVSANPDALPAGIKLAAGVALTDEDLAEVRAFLRCHGTYGELPRLPPEVAERLREHVRGDVKREMMASELPAPEAAFEALLAAGNFVRREGVRLREGGIRLSPGMLNSVATETREAATQLDLLKVRANRVRAAFQQFEATLKASGLMKSVARRSQIKTGRQP